MVFKKINHLKLFILLFLFIASVGLFGFYQNVSSQKNEFPFSGEFEEETLLVKFKSETQAENKLQTLDIDSEKIKETKVFKVDKKDNQTIADLYSQLKNDPNVESVQPNFIYETTLTPNDTLYSSQWALPKISASSGWDKTTGSSSITIGVIDTGVQFDHSDLSNKIWSNPGETLNGLDDDGNGYIDDIRGWNFADNNNNVNDIHGHGTLVAGVAAAETNNSRLIAGVDWHAKIVPLRIWGEGGSGGTTAELIEALNYARNKNINVINMSLGTSSHDPLFKNALDQAYNANMVLVAASGNSNSSNILYPAKYSNVLAVGATNQNDIRCTPSDWGDGKGSNYGPELDVVAPGNYILTTTNNNGHGYGYGTSLATPHVAGLASLLKSVNSSFSNSQIMDFIRHSADKVTGMAGQNFTNEYGYGRININRTLNNPVYTWQLISYSADKSLNGLSPNETATITVTAKNTGNLSWLKSGSNPILLGTNNPKDRSSLFRASGWLNSGRPAILTQDEVIPGENGTFVFEIKVPNKPGSYSESFSLVAEGLTWFNEQDLNIPITINGNYSWQIHSQSTSKLLTGLSPGDEVTFTVVAQNTGNTIWYNSGVAPVNLGTSGPQDRISPFFTSGNWLNAARPAKLTEAEVLPGENGTFAWTSKIPARNGAFSERYSLVAEGIKWFNDPGLTFSGSINNYYAWQPIAQAASKNLVGLSPGETVTLTLIAKNIGNTTWRNSGSSPITLGTSSPRDRISPFFTSGNWLNAARPAKLTEAEVLPGENGTFVWNITVPFANTVYRENVSLVAEGITWLNDPGLNYYITINKGYGWQFVSQTSDKNLAGLALGETANITLTAKNVGTATWFRTGKYPMILGTTNPRDRSSAFVDSGWLNAGRPTLMPADKSSVSPGETVTFAWTIKAPQNIGIYREHFSLVLEGAGWLNEPGINFYVVVGWTDILEGVPMPATSGLTTFEQHLSLTQCAEPSATHYSVSQTPIAARNGMAWETSGGCGYGAWGVSPPVDDERYYINMRWNYTTLHGQPYYKEKSWYYRKRVIVVNPANGKKLIASIIEYGPAPWTGRVSGLSPEAMNALGAVNNSNLEYHWYLNQSAPVGPLN